MLYPGGAARCESRNTLIIVGLVIWYASNPVLAEEVTHLVCNDFPPLKIEHPGTDNLPGSDVDLLRDLFHRAGLPLEITYLPWKRAFAAAQEGAVDGLCSCSYLADREADFFFTQEIGRTSVGVFSLTSSSVNPSPPVSDLAALKAAAQVGKVVGVVGGYALEADIDDVSIPRDLAPDDAHALDMLTHKRYDYLYSYEAPIQFLAKYAHDGESVAKSLTYHEVHSSPYYLCLSRKVARNAALLTPLNAALADMRKDGTIDRILDKYR